MQVVVLMGGLGTRLGLKDVPKAMADVNGKPFFDYQLALLKRWGFHQFLFLVGHQGEKIVAHYGDGTAFGVNILYSHDGDAPQGTGGALKKAEDLLEEDFLLIYGDSFMDIDYRELVYDYCSRNHQTVFGVMTIFHNHGRLDKSNVGILEDDLIVYDKKNPSQDMEYIDYGVSIFEKGILRYAPNGRFDIADLVSTLTRERKLVGHIVTRRFYEIGSPASLDEFRGYAKKRFAGPQKAAFFDRDGVINELVFHEGTEQLDSPFDMEDFCYMDGILDILAFLQEKDYLIFVVTNQPAAAKGKVPLRKLYALNHWMEQDLRRRGIDVEFIHMCPHHPTGTAYTRERFLIQSCNCRKPKSGLVEELLSVYAVDQSHSFLVGDSYTDVLAAKGAGLQAVLLGSLKCDACKRLEGNHPDFILTDISELRALIEQEAL